MMWKTLFVLLALYPFQSLAVDCYEGQSGPRCPVYLPFVETVEISQTTFFTFEIGNGGGTLWARAPFSEEFGCVPSLRIYKNVSSKGEYYYTNGAHYATHLLDSFDRGRYSVGVIYPVGCTEPIQFELSIWYR